MLVMVAVIFVLGVAQRFALLRAPATELASGQDEELLSPSAMQALGAVGIYPEAYATNILALVINGLLLWRGSFAVLPPQI